MYKLNKKISIVINIKSFFAIILHIIRKSIITSIYCFHKLHRKNFIDKLSILIFNLNTCLITILIILYKIFKEYLKKRDKIK